MASEAQQAIKKVHSAGDDYYGVLGISKGSSDDEIKKAYRKLALRLHPDKCSEEGTEEAFKKVGEAFGVLSDPKKRSDFDQFGVDGMRDRGGGGQGPVNAEDIFEAFFGGGGFPGGATFVQGGQGRGGGFQTFRVSSGGFGGGNVFHFSSGGGNPMGGGFGGGGGGMHQRRGGGGAAVDGGRRKAAQEQKEEEMASSAWVEKIQNVLGPAGALLGPLLPMIILMVVVLFLVLMGKIMQILVSRAIVILPIYFVTEGRTKLYLISAIVVGAMCGIL